MSEERPRKTRKDWRQDVMDLNDASQATRWDSHDEDTRRFLRERRPQLEAELDAETENSENREAKYALEELRQAEEDRDRDEDDRDR